MTSTPADGNPFHGLAEEASATLRELLAAEGLTDEASSVLPPFERVVRASVTAVMGSAPADDVTLDFALAYLTGRIAKEQVIALQHVCTLVNVARARAEHHRQAAMESRARGVARKPCTPTLQYSKRTIYCQLEMSGCHLGGEGIVAEWIEGCSPETCRKQVIQQLGEDASLGYLVGGIKAPGKRWLSSLLFHC